MPHKKPLLSFSSFSLKYIALATMTLDHIAAVLLPYGTPLYTALRGIGRVAFPVYCFLLVEGYLHTSNRKAYFTRLLLFAFVSELPFDMAIFHFPFVKSWSALSGHQNVFFTLAFGFLSMYILDYHWFRQRMTGFTGMILIGILAEILNFDYGLNGILMILLIFICRRFRPDIPPLFVAILTVLPLFSLQSISGVCVVLSIPFLTLYNGQKGSPLPGGKTFPGAKYLFYSYYPIHLFIISILYFFIK